jgi:hypothetical protein
MKLIRNFNDFVSKRKVNENIDTLETPESQELENEEAFEETEENEENDDANIIDDVQDDLPGDDSDFEEEVEETEEEGHEYEGTKKMNELAEMLDAEVVDNKIAYNGQIINYFSETEKFHIGKMKFDTPEEVVQYLDTEE